MEAANSIIPSLIVSDFVTGSTPDLAKLNELANFAARQYEYYSSVGVSMPSLGPYEALGLGYASTSEFTTRFGGLSNEVFIEKVYSQAFGRSASDAQLLHFQKQITYFQSLYEGVGVDTAIALIRAKGAVLGQILGFAVLENDNPYAVAAFEFSQDAVDGVALFGESLLGAYGHIAPNPLALIASQIKTFVSANAPIHLVLSDNTFSTDISNIAVFINGTRISQSALAFSADRSHLNVGALLNDGPNAITVYARNSLDEQLVLEDVLWAGSQTVEVRVAKAGQLVSGVLVEARLTEDQSVVATAITNSAGMAKFFNLPDRGIEIQVEQGSAFGSIGILGSQAIANVELLELNPPSTVDNNDFSLGLSGWTIGNASVTIEQHQESAAVALQQVQSIAAAGANQDGVLITRGLVEQHFGRTIAVKADTESITVRYKFITSEIPAGYFGSKYNDYFRISIRDSSGNELVETANMNGLGLGSFDANGATPFRELTLLLAPGVKSVQVDAYVANVGDDQFDSKIVLDYIAGQQFTISKLNLLDLNVGNRLPNEFPHNKENWSNVKEQLKFLSIPSAESEAAVKSGTKIFGNIELRGSEDDKLASVQLEVMLGSNIIATAELSAAAKKVLIGPTFGVDKILSFSTVDWNVPLFELTAQQAKDIQIQSNQVFTVRVKAVNASGEIDTEGKGYEKITGLGFYTGTNRYSAGNDRDVTQGGDGWALPSTIDMVKHFSQLIVVNDFSNMNGNSFRPDHSEHRTGTQVDARVGAGGIPITDMNSVGNAKGILELLNDPTYGPQIQRILVAFDKAGAFYQELVGKTVFGGRLATDLIVNDKEHTDHIHIDFYASKTEKILPAAAVGSAETAAAYIYEVMSTAALSSNELSSLADHSAQQLITYRNIGVTDLELGRYEALGIRLAVDKGSDSELLSQSNENFARIAYSQAFGRSPEDDQLQHFLDQLSYFESRQVGKGMDAYFANLAAKGAVLGQIVGWAVREYEMVPNIEVLGAATRLDAFDHYNL